MAGRGMVFTTDLIAPLAERGIDLSRSQVHRLVTRTPRRAGISTLLALCDILDCQLTDIAVPVTDGSR
jgi:DNA-binding Xre family transcriptional regulator